MNCSAPEITPMSSPNIKPANAARMQVNTAVAFARVATGAAVVAFMVFPGGCRLGGLAWQCGTQSFALRRRAGKARLRQAGGARRCREQRAGGGLVGERGGIQAIARAGDVEHRKICSAEGRAGRLRGGYRDAMVQAAISGIARHAEIGRASCRE